MELKEVKEFIATSPNKEWYHNFSFSINFSHLDFQKTFLGVYDLYEFLVNQVAGYEAFGTLPQQLSLSRDRFLAARNNTLQLITSNNIIDPTWRNNLSGIVNNVSQIFPSTISETAFLVKLNLTNSIYFQAAFEYFTGVVSHVTNKNYLIGYLLAYEFSTKEISLIAQRKETEKKSLSKIKSDYEKQIGESQKELIEFISQANNNAVEFSKKLDSLKESKQQSFEKWFNTASKNLTDFQSSSNTTISDLENLYREKLKLEAPARYWRDRAKKLRREGIVWISGVIISIGITVFILLLLLYRFTDENVLKVFEHTGTAIKWSVLLITTISFLAYGIKAFSKLTFSSFHLMRDAEEKEQLTYVYLALSKQKDIDTTERQLVMQALFSRADTGLLKEDAGPTMPGHVIDQVARK